MSNRKSSIQFRSVLASWIEQFIQEKQACGYKYATETESLWRLDRFLCEQDLAVPELPKALVNRWIVKDPNESSRTQQARIGLVRRFAEFLIRQGCPAHVPDARLAARTDPGFVPRIFTKEEMRKLLAAADAIRANPRSPLRHRIMAEIFRVLYGCGLRVGEAIRLRFRDVNLVSGVLTIHQGKFRKDRLVPMAPSLTERLRPIAVLTPSFSPHRAQAFTTVRRSITPFGNCSGNVVSPMADGAKVHVFMTFVTRLPFTDWSSGTRKELISTRNFRCWPRIWAIKASARRRFTCD
jgi:integrase/recombinase XerD